MKCPCFHDLQSCGHVVVCLWLLCVTVVEHNIGLMRNTCWSYPYVTLILMVDLRSHGDDQEQPSQTVILPLHDGQYCRMLCIIWEYKCRSMWQAVPYVVRYCGSVDMDDNHVALFTAWHTYLPCRKNSRYDTRGKRMTHWRCCKPIYGCTCFSEKIWPWS